MPATLIKLTKAGRAAFIGPDNMGTVARKVAKIGVATAPFVPTDELLALPNERKKLDTFGGENIADDTIHVTLRDDTDDQYSLYGFGLYLDNGVLLGTCGQNTPILEKSLSAMMLLSADMRITEIDPTLIEFGNSNWTNPKATTERQGVVELATDVETQQGADAERAVTPAGLAARTATATRTGLVELATDAEAQTGIDTVRAVTPANLSARTATETRTGLVELATDAETQTGTDAARVVTPANLSARTATETRTGLAAIASQVEANTASDDSKIITPKKLGVYVAAAIAALVDSSPATLNTLRELATALGDDPNFATTTINALALKAPLASPALTGTPTVPTAAGGTATPQAASTDFVQQAIGAGAIAFFARSTAPAGWLKANGAAVSRTAYAALFAAISTWWGVGDGVNTFNLPDLRGEFLRGWDDGRGTDPGRVFASGQGSQNLAHSHQTLTPGANGFWVDAPGRYAINAGGTGVNFNLLPNPTSEGSGGNESRPRNVALLACIKI
ncbi:phage tail protein [Cupriavidus plantarum]|uniref:phage tail protein n=1 Tax=Cupriavidus plantarum TaxID=942865 RepID=UPI000E3B4079|nr:phage tail protein [Cupriavidus plantarum]REE92636.1 tail collar domain [Cupriavidus plantarum]